MTNTYSQSTLLWSVDYAPGLNHYTSEYPIIQTIDDTIKVIGRKNTENGQQLLIVKYDLLGNTISETTYDIDSMNNNSIIDYKFDTSNHIYILNKENLGYYKSKIVLQKYSLDGALIWETQIQNPEDTSYTPHSIGLVNDTCLFITVYKDYNYPASADDPISTIRFSQLYAYHSDGNLLWQRDFNPSTEINWFENTLFIHNNTAYLFGKNISLTTRLLKVDINNTLTINSNTDIINGIHEIQLTPDSNLLITAYIQYCISKVSLTGSLIWREQYGTNLPGNVSGDEIKATIQDSLGNIYVTGRHYGMNYGTAEYTNADILTLKYNSNGNLCWQNRYIYGINNGDVGNTLVMKNGQIYVGANSQRFGGLSDCDYVVLKIDSSSGISTGVYRYNGVDQGNDAVSSLSVFENGNVALTGLSYINSQYDWTTQLLSDVILSVQNIDKANSFQIYPNPIANGEILTIIGQGINSFSIISAIGQIVQEGTLSGMESNTINMNRCAPGIYVLYLETETGILSRKLIVNQ